MPRAITGSDASLPSAGRRILRGFWILTSRAVADDQAIADVDQEDAAGTSAAKKPARKAVGAGKAKAAPKEAKAATKTSKPKKAAAK